MARPKKKSEAPDCDEPLDDVLSRLGIAKWDFLIVGDGSGSNWNRECAWASVSVERATMERLEWFAYANRGTVNTAEAMAYLLPLMWIAGREADRLKEGSRRRACRVHVVTDSEYVRNSGRSEDRQKPAHSLLWESYETMSRQGVIIKWHWIPRNSVGLHERADALGKLVRRTFKEYNLQQTLSERGSEVKTVYDINPG